LRPRRAPVMRLSRRVLVGFGVVAAAGISVALFFAWQPQRRTTGLELCNTDNRTTPDGLANLPRDYGELPRSAPQLGPPLPSDLGRPILNTGAPAAGMAMSPSSNAEEQRTAQEQEAALTSHLFATTNLRRDVRAVAPTLPAVAAGATRSGIAASATDPVSQDHKLAFVNGNIDRRTSSPDRVQPPPSPYVLQAGSVTPAALLALVRTVLGHSIVVGKSVERQS
jgi:type IV secretion system protein TrbI